MSTLCYIGLGGNLGDAQQTLRQALGALRALDTGESMRVSRFYRSAPVNAPGDDFINAVACFQPALSAPELLWTLQKIELHFGRLRPYFNAPRTLDLDLLLYGDLQLHTNFLTLPHPRIHQRAFVLHPLLELAPDIILPGLGAAKDFLPAVENQVLEPLDESILPRT